MCNEGLGLATFDLTTSNSIDGEIDEDIIEGYYMSVEDLEAQQNEILDPNSFRNIIPTMQNIYVRIQEEQDPNDEMLVCYQVGQIPLIIESCAPTIPEGFSPNGDGINDTFEIIGLRDVFRDYELFIYSRLGNVVYEGNNDVEFWDGTPNAGFGGDVPPTGVYYWVLQFNDSTISDLSGWVYLNRESN